MVAVVGSLVVSAGRGDGLLDAGEVAFVLFDLIFPVSQLVLAFDHEVLVSRLYGVLQCEDGGAEFGARVPDLATEFFESEVRVSVREPAPSDCRVECFGLVREAVEAFRLRLVVAALRRRYAAVDG